MPRAKALSNSRAIATSRRWQRSSGVTVLLALLVVVEDAFDPGQQAVNNSLPKLTRRPLLLRPVLLQQANDRRTHPVPGPTVMLAAIIDDGVFLRIPRPGQRRLTPTAPGVHISASLEQELHHGDAVPIHRVHQRRYPARVGEVHRSPVSKKRTDRLWLSPFDCRDEGGLPAELSGTPIRSSI